MSSPAFTSYHNHTFTDVVRKLPTCAENVDAVPASCFSAPLAHAMNKQGCNTTLVNRLTFHCVCTLYPNTIKDFVHQMHPVNYTDFESNYEDMCEAYHNGGIKGDDMKTAVQELKGQVTVGVNAAAKVKTGGMIALVVLVAALVL